MFGITCNERKSELEHRAKNAKVLVFVLPKAMRIAPVLSDSGQKAQRGLSLAHLTVAAALYFAGWLDDEFKLIRDLISFSKEEQPNRPQLKDDPSTVCQDCYPVLPWPGPEAEGYNKSFMSSLVSGWWRIESARPGGGGSKRSRSTRPKGSGSTERLKVR